MIVMNPVPSTTQFLVSPFLPTYVMHTSPAITVNFTILNFFTESMNTPILAGVTAYVKNVTINGKPNLEGSRCFFDFYDVFKTDGEVVIELTADRGSVETRNPTCFPLGDRLRQGKKLLWIYLWFCVSADLRWRNRFSSSMEYSHMRHENRDRSIDGEALSKRGEWVYGMKS